MIGLIGADVPPGVLVESLEGNGGDRQEAQVRKGQTCSCCGASGINGVSKLMLHMDRMHSKSVTCSICEVVFVDKYSFLEHSQTCYYWCPVEGCNYHEKRESRFKGHLRTHRLV